MTNILKIIFYSGVLSALAACSLSQKDGQKENSSQGMSYHEQAVNVKSHHGAPEKYIALQLKAVEEMRQGRAKESGMEILSQMGYFYFRSGQYMEALTYLQEATDSMRNMPLKKNNIEEGAKLLGTTANIYGMLGLYGEALELNAQAIELCRKGNNNRIPDLWRMRGATFSLNNQLDSGLMCIRKAIEATDDMEDKNLAKISKTYNQLAYAVNYIEHPNYAPDSIAMAMRLLERIYQNNRDNAFVQFSIGRGYVLQGNADKGIGLMTQALKAYRQNYGTDDIEWALNLYSQSLLEKELSPKTLAIYKEWKQMSDSIAKAHKKNALLGADFKYRTTQAKNDMQLIKNQMDIERERTVWTGVIIFIIGLVVATLTVMRNYNNNMIIKNNKEAINSLIQERITLNSKIEKLSEQLNERIAQNGIQNVENTEAYSELLATALLTKEDEKRFRLLFDSIFPGYIQRIRTNYEGMSATAELICMLIRLNKSNEEISLALGIKRESVVKSRYRLRTLFKLDKDTDLNKFVTSL